MWTYVKRTPDRNVLPMTWVFRVKPLKWNGYQVLHKARCCLRRDFQVVDVNHDPYSTYATVALHESIRTLFAYASSSALIVQEDDVVHASLYGPNAFTVLIEQPTYFSKHEVVTGHSCLLQKFMYVFRQTGRIWMSFSVDTLVQWDFKKSSTDDRLRFLLLRRLYLFFVIIVHDLAFRSSYAMFAREFKERFFQRSA